MNRAQLRFGLQGLHEQMYDPRIIEVAPPAELAEKFTEVMDYVHASTRAVDDLVEEHQLVRELADAVALHAMLSGSDELYQKACKLLLCMEAYLQAYEVT